MDSFRSMEWNSKWDWENLDMFGSKVSESPQKLQHTDWGIVEGEIDAGSFNLSGGGGDGAAAGGSGGSGSDLMHGSSAKSSISASTDCSSKQGMTTSNFTFEPIGGFPKKNELMAGNGNSQSSLDASVGSGEPLIGLTLGKRAYFENTSCTGSNGKGSSFSANPPPASSSSTTRKLKISSSSSSSCQKGALISRCQVEGCNLDLSSAKEYHRKHRVCETHSKSSKVVVAGVERRFCQQCSRFHSLAEFDDKKRSCRRRLSDHNARRRKPQQETLHFNSTRLSSASYGTDGRQQQMGFVLNNFPHQQSRGVSNWESSSSSSKCTRQPKGFHLLKPEKMVVPSSLSSTFIDNHHHLPSPAAAAAAFSIPPNHETRCMLPPCRPNPSSSVFGQDFKEPIFSGNIDAAAPDFGRALSLLSTTTNSWGSCSYDPSPGPGPCSTLVNHQQPMHHVVGHSNIMMTQHQHQHQHMMMHESPQGFPLVSSSSSEYWPHNHSSNDAHVHVHASAAPPDNNNASSTSHFHLFRSPHHPPSFYSNHLN